MNKREIKTANLIRLAEYRNMFRKNPSQGEDNTQYYRSDVEPDRLFFDEPIRSSSITFTIESASRGTKYEDTAISEIEIYGY